MARKPVSVDVRLWRRVEKKGASECWPWKGCIDSGYGRISVRIAENQHIDKGVHCVAYELVKGPIPAGLFVCHSCDNPLCCNPDHLFLGTPKENSQDMVRKNRQSKGVKHQKVVRKGEAHYYAKLLNSQVFEIKKTLRQGESYRNIATRYGVSVSTIRAIKQGELWKHISIEQ